MGSDFPNAEIADMTTYQVPFVLRDDKSERAVCNRFEQFDDGNSPATGVLTRRSRVAQEGVTEAVRTKGRFAQHVCRANVDCKTESLQIQPVKSLAVEVIANIQHAF